eukprot:CAMPEP_0178412644 /NCGR_PEP_ID=MMETSP0689_2-20121128/22120_1 /TAXON_ID=160604 /ORGANISM="Amphidinium massartii, Strain CS-259" /LENGTH=324 /DNA_ID=CAMNT_0020033895 /DNA_START=36 /DNA_END=1010 /DNA_ORIENTATION=+
MKEIRKKFKEMDKDGNGKLDFKEFAGLLRKGNPNMSQRELRSLFNAVDKSHDGRIQFEEFLEFIFSNNNDLEHVPAPEEVRKAFTAYCEAPPFMENTQFSRLLKDCMLHDQSFTPADDAIIFARINYKGERWIDVDQFETALGLIAQKKGINVQEVHSKVAEYCVSGPHYKGTECVNMEAVLAKYEDQLDRDLEAMRSQRQEEAEGDGLDWSRAKEAFDTYAKNSYLDGTEFAQMCRDCHLFDKGFGRVECDLAFSKVAKHQKRIEFKQFPDLLKLVAEERDCLPYELLYQVSVAAGPDMKGTKADFVRLHDDRSTYTGTHMYR